MQIICSFKRAQFILMVLAACTIITVLMILFFFNYPSFAKQRVIESVVFKNNTDSMDRFLTTKDLKNLRTSFYFFSVMNADEVVKNSSAKIDLKEIGPFVYHEYKAKEFINNNQTSGKITYRLRRMYIFERDLSVGDPKKILITWPNVPLIVAKSFIDKLSFFQRQIAYIALNHAIETQHEPAFIVDTVDNFLFHGSKRKFFDYLESWDKLKIINPWPLKDNMFALMYGRNNTLDSKFNPTLTMSAGFGVDQSYKNLNEYLEVNGSSTLPYWRQYPKTCNKVGGTDGQFFPPFIDQDKDLEIFSMDICRKLKFEFSHSTYIKGISALKYSLKESSLQSYQKNRENQCYCLNSNYTDCDLDGLIDLSSCNYPKVLGSGVHFYAGSPELVTRVSGLTAPNASLHEPVIYVEPNTGITVKVRVPVQFNVKLEKGGFKIFEFFQDNKTLILPLTYAIESSEVTEDQANLLKSRLLLLDSWLVTMVLGGAILGILTILVVSCIICIRYRNSRGENDERSHLLATGSSQLYTEQVES